MAIVLFDPALIQARLSSQVATLKKVGGSADLTSAQQDLKNKLPAAYVVENRETPGPNEIVTLVSQRNATRFSVVLALQNLRDPRGEAAQQALRPIRVSIITALLGWPPGPEYDVCLFGGGRLLKLDDGVLWWQDDFVTSLYLRSA